MSEIEKYYNGEIHVDFDEKTIENDFDKAVEFMVESDFNKDLNKCLDIVKELDKKDKEIERLKSIIKEVREYLESIETDYAIGCWNKEDEFIDVKKDILNILDKESELC